MVPKASAQDNTGARACTHTYTDTHIDTHVHVHVERQRLSQEQGALPGSQRQMLMIVGWTGEGCCPCFQLMLAGKQEEGPGWADGVKEVDWGVQLPREGGDPAGHGASGGC